jgi:hypothetical protein
LAPVLGALADLAACGQLNSGELSTEAARHTKYVRREVFHMTPLLMLCLSAATPLAAIGLLNLQARLERWDYERHAED